MTKAYINVKDAAVYLGVSQRSVWNWIYQRIIPTYRLGRAVRLKISDLESFAQAGMVPAREA